MCDVHSDGYNISMFQPQNIQRICITWFKLLSK